MAVKITFISLLITISAFGSKAEGELTIIHSPESLNFRGSSTLRESVLKEVFSASLGLSVEENSNWNGLNIIDPFNTPEAVVEVYIDGVASLGKSADLKGHHYPLLVDEYEPETYDAIKHRILQRFSMNGNKIVSVRLSNEDEINHYSDLFGTFNTPKVTKRSLQHLKTSVEEDYQFLAELENLKTITERVKSSSIGADNAIDFYNFRFRTLHPLADLHGHDSLQAKEAKKLLAEAINELSDSFVKAYDGSVLVAAVTSDVAHTRRAQRSVPTRQENTTSAQNNLAAVYSKDYPAIFNIILWFGIVFAFTLIAIVYAIMDMDPGRDSIIYRMTSTRMKKDN